jgi:ankyrin repeat protein
VEQCGWDGVGADGIGVVARCTNVEVRQCGGSGVVADNGASVTLIGAKTTVHHNCTKGESGDYGLQVSGSSSSTIHLLSPLTKEQVAIDNGGGGNWGAVYGGDIHQIKTITHRDVFQTLPTFMKRQILAFFGYKDYTLAGRTCPYLYALWTKAMERKRLPLFVPADCKTLKEAVERVHEEDRLTTIVVGKGEHQIIGNFLKISSAMHIVGDPGVPKEKIVVMGGIYFKKGIQGNCHLQHLTLCQAKKCGVAGESPFTMEDVLVEQCGLSGVVASGTGVVGRCTNVKVRQCGWSGVVADNGASVTLIGAKTTVHHNCAKGNRDEYGLKVYGSFSSTIHLLSPLTKEQVAIDNAGGGNWGAEQGADINQITTILSSSLGESTALAPHEPDEQCCFRCLKPLLKETTTAKRMRFKCCGEAMHLDCLGEAFKGKTPTYFRENDPICPCCHKLYPAHGSDEEWAILKDWAAEGKAWAYCIMAFRIKAGYFRHASFYSQSLIKDNYEKAALLGNAIGMLNVGTLYANASHGVERCYAKAVKWWTKAAALGDATSIRCLKILGNSQKLFDACNQGNLKAVKVVMADGVNANFQREDGWTPLLVVCVKGGLGIVKVLLARKLIQINQALHNGATPLYMACDKGHVKVVNALLARKEVQINLATNNGVTPLYLACQNDRVKVVDALLARKEIQINQAMHDGTTPLYAACQNDHVKVVNALLARKEIQLNQATNNGWTPLSIACRNGHVKVVKVLLTHKKIDINTQFNGTTPLKQAIQNGHTEIAALLEQHKGAK